MKILIPNNKIMMMMMMMTVMMVMMMMMINNAVKGKWKKRFLTLRDCNLSVHKSLEASSVRYSSTFRPQHHSSLFISSFYDFEIFIILLFLFHWAHFFEPNYLFFNIFLIYLFYFILFVIFIIYYLFNSIIPILYFN
jgi:hypothetical protein